MTTALVFPNVSTASWDVEHARGPDPREDQRFAGFLERALIDSEPPSDPRIGSSDNRSYDRETEESRIVRDESNARDVHDDRKARETDHAREADERVGSDDERTTRKDQNPDRSDETDTRAEDRASVAKPETEDSTESNTRGKTSERRTTDATGVAAGPGVETGKAAKVKKRDSLDGAAVAGADVKKSSADDDEISRAGAAGVQKQLDREEAHGPRLNAKHGAGEAESRHAAIGDEESERVDAANSKKSDRGAPSRGVLALDRAETVRSDRSDSADKREDRGKKRGDDRSERVGSRDRADEPRVKVIDARRAERLDSIARGEASGSADENRTSSDAPSIEIRNPGGHESLHARNPMRYAEAAAELARSLRESANAEIVREARIILRTENSGEIRLVLRPEELGNVRIRLQMQDNHIAGRILVENSSIREIFAQNMDDLARAFAEAGIELGSMEVSVGDGERSDPDDRPRSEGPQRAAGEFERNTHAVVYYGFEETRVNVFA